MTRQSLDIEAPTETHALTPGAVTSDLGVDLSDGNGIDCEACWKIFKLCCVATCMVIIFIVSTVHISYQEEARNDIIDRWILISEPYINHSTYIACTPSVPCNVTCHNYMDVTASQPDRCYFNDLLLILAQWFQKASFVLCLCGSIVLFCAYQCHKDAHIKRPPRTPKRGRA